MPDHHVVLVGAGLANSLIAWRLATARDDCRVTIVERGADVGGNHTWSFHLTDMTAEALIWLKPFIAHQWPAYTVMFPGLTRRFDGGYASIPSDRLRDLIRSNAKITVESGADAVKLDPASVVLSDGRRIDGDCVIDGRGVRSSKHMTLGYQKFFGREFRLKKPHGLTCPILMDATVPQEDGYRFLYSLPFGERDVLVEDTRYADGSALDDAELQACIDRYLQSRGWEAESVLREERGVLPIVLTGDIEKFWDEGASGVARSGLAAVLFNSATGYSLPYAVRLADEIAKLTSFEASRVYRLTRDVSVTTWEKAGLFRLVNRMLFRAAEPSERWRPMKRFHTLPEDLVSRFYAGQPTFADKARILVGKPPVPFFRALTCIDDRHPA
jgi:lycopene beta-cyclase